MQLARVLGAATITTLSLLAAHPASATGFADPYKYYSKADPLTAYDDGVAQAEMHGKFSVEEATYLRNDTHQRDPRPGGDAVFERTQYLWYIHTTDGMAWVSNGQDQGPKTTSSTWYDQYDHQVINPNGDKGRMRTQVCEDHGIWPDPCSVWPQFTTDL